jgi:hypothetical protein
VTAPVLDIAAAARLILTSNLLTGTRTVNAGTLVDVHNLP